MRRAFIVLLLAACPPVPATVYPTARCLATSPLPVTADVCPRMFNHGYACVKCPSGEMGCIDTVDQVYCASSCLDPNCVIVP